MKEKQPGDDGVNAMTFRGLFRIKPLDSILQQAEEPEYKLNRTLGPLALTLFGVGAIIGAGPYGFPMGFNLLAVLIITAITLVLHPTVNGRAERALAGRGSEKAAAGARSSMAVAAILGVITIIYPVIALTHSQPDI